MKGFFRIIASFGALQLLTLISPFLLLPIVARIAGEAGWASIAIGQAIGNVAGIAVNYGWSLRGPSRIARAEQGENSGIFAESLASRAVVFAVVAPGAILITAILSEPDFVLLSSGMTFAMMLTGMSPNWFYIGIGKVRPLIYYAAIPKLASNVLGAILILATRNLLIYPIVLIAASIFTLVSITIRVTTLSRLRTALHWRRIFYTLRDHTPATGTDILEASFSSAPLIVAGVLLPALPTSQLASADKLYKLGLYAVSALGSAVQSWIYGPNRHPSLRRSKAAILAHLTLGVLGGISLALIGPLATSILFGSSLSADFNIMFWYGITYIALNITTSLMRHVLFPAKRDGFVLLANGLAAFFGLPTMVILTIAFGAPGVVAGLAISQFIVTTVLIYPAFTSVRRLR